MESVIAALNLALAVLIAIFLSSCGPLLGLKTIQKGDTRVEFITGVDFGIGLNGVDSVDNRRGIVPSGGAKFIAAKD